MPATIVVGGQYGSEGKGKVVALLAARSEAPLLVRCGGPNSGHTVTLRGRRMVLRQVPSCTDYRCATLFVAAGCVVDEDVLLSELDALDIDQARIVIDPRAVLVTDADREKERNEIAGIASTCSGNGAAIIRRMQRKGGDGLVGSSVRICDRCRVEPVAPLLHEALNEHRNVIVEGTQGFGLSLLHSDSYPFVTSRDTTASGFAAEVGLAPRHIDGVVLVIRTFPIRVGGPSGPLMNETTWDQVAIMGGSPDPMPEYTSVTNKLRRVGLFDIEAVKKACRYNQPTSIAVMGLDRLDYKNFGASRKADLTQSAFRFLDSLEAQTGVPVELVGTGFDTQDAITLPAAVQSTVSPAHE